MPGRILKSPISICLAFCAAFGIYWFYDFKKSEALSYQVSQVLTTKYVSSSECGACHPGHYESWKRTYHRTMTAAATPENMKAPVDQLIKTNFYGYAVHFEKQENTYFVTLPYFDGSYKRFPLLYTIGSRRMQQFAIQDGDKIYRIPVFYSLDRKKWMHINSAFFRRRGSGLASFVQGYGIWNPNCIFCHNTRPNPQLDLTSRKFSSHVAETGIACEECHGPGELHSKVNHNPLRRIFHQYKQPVDQTIQHAKKLEKMKSVQVCGQCHGQRLPQPLDRIEQLMSSGDPYVPGADLFEYYKPVQQTDRLGSYDLFRLRFWKDGSPRLTAFELHGLIQSKCFLMSADLTCETCHNSHGGDPKGMINSEMRTNKACTQCHEKYQTTEQVQAHTKHEASSTTCYSCHMPEVVYGVMTIHPTHFIRNPDPSRTVKFNMPNECNTCHLDKSVNWSIAQFQRLWNLNLTQGDSTFDEPEIIRGFLNGDAVYRVNLLYHAKKSELKNFEMVYQAAVKDDFYIVSLFAMDALESRYRKKFISENEWLQFLAQEKLQLLIDPGRLTRKAADEPFEFGE